MEKNQFIETFNKGFKWSYDKTKQFCTTLDNLIIINLKTLFNTGYDFIYPNLNSYDYKDLDMLFDINKSKKIITLMLSNRNQNNYNYDVYDDENPINRTTKYKKYVSCYIKKSLLPSFTKSIETISQKQELDIKIKDEYELTNFDYKEFADMNHNIEVQKKLTFENTLTFIDNGNGFKSFYDINRIFKYDIHFLNNDIMNELKNDYIGILVYEDAINTETNLIEIIYKINNKL